MHSLDLSDSLCIGIFLLLFIISSLEIFFCNLLYKKHVQNRKNVVNSKTI